MFVAFIAVVLLAARRVTLRSDLYRVRTVFETVLVAGRGEIARRVTRTLRRLEVRSIAAYSEADAGLPFVLEADEAVLLGPADPRQSYLDGERLIEAAKRSGAQALHPCYGFLSESAAFAERVQAAGLVWIGPPPTAMAAHGRQDRRPAHHGGCGGSGRRRHRSAGHRRRRGARGCGSGWATR